MAALHRRSQGILVLVNAANDLASSLASSSSMFKAQAVQQ